MLSVEMIEALDEVWKAPRRWLNGIRYLKGELHPEVAATPHRVVKSWGRVRLLAYDPPGGPAAPPLLMVPSVINRYYVLDLTPGKSLVEHLVNSGTPVYMIDWGRPGPQDRFAGWEQHVLGWLHAAVRASCRDARARQIHLLGYCIGGTMAAMYAARRPERVAGLVALTTPIGFQDSGILCSWTRHGDVPVEKMVEHWGLVPGDFLQGSFTLLQPGAQVTKHRNLFASFWDEVFLEGFLGLDTWVTDSVGVPGAFYLRLIKELYEQDALRQGRFGLAGEMVRLEEIRCPVLVAVSTRDHIVPDDSATCLADLVGSADREVLELPGGHIGVVVGGAARRAFWPALTNWIRARPVAPREVH